MRMTFMIWGAGDQAQAHTHAREALCKEELHVYSPISKQTEKTVSLYSPCWPGTHGGPPVLASLGWYYKHKPPCLTLEQFL